METSLRINAEISETITPRKLAWSMQILQVLTQLKFISATFFCLPFYPSSHTLNTYPLFKHPQPHSSVTCNRKSFLISFCVLTALYSCAFWPWKYRKTEVPSRGSRQKVWVVPKGNGVGAGKNTGRSVGEWEKCSENTFLFSSPPSFSSGMTFYNSLPAMVESCI